jgi:hypothetical protein
MSYKCGINPIIIPDSLSSHRNVTMWQVCHLFTVISNEVLFKGKIAMLLLLWQCSKLVPCFCIHHLSVSVKWSVGQVPVTYSTFIVCWRKKSGRTVRQDLRKVKGKVKCSVLSWVPYHEAIWGSGGVAAYNHKHITKWKWVVNFTPLASLKRKEPPGIYLGRSLDRLQSMFGCWDSGSSVFQPLAWSPFHPEN